MCERLIFVAPTEVYLVTLHNNCYFAIICTENRSMKDKQLFTD